MGNGARPAVPVYNQARGGDAEPDARVNGAHELDTSANVPELYDTASFTASPPMRQGSGLSSGGRWELFSDGGV